MKKIDDTIFKVDIFIFWKLCSKNQDVYTWMRNPFYDINNESMNTIMHVFMYDWLLAVFKEYLTNRANFEYALTCSVQVVFEEKIYTKHTQNIGN